MPDNHRNDRREALKTRLKSVVLSACQVQGVRPDQIEDAAPLIGGPGPLQLDSLDALEIAMAVRREFGVEMEDVGGAAEALRSIGSLADFLLARVPVEASSPGAAPPREKLGTLSAETRTSPRAGLDAPGAADDR